MRAWSLAALLLPGVLALAAACGSTDSGDDSGPAITLSLVPGGSVAVGAPTMTMALRDSDGAIANDLVRLSLGALPPLGNGGRYELWVVDVVSGISSLNTFISFGRFNTEATPQAAFVQLPGSATAVDPLDQAVDFAQVESDKAALTAVLPVDLSDYDEVWISVETESDDDVIPGGSHGPSPVLVGQVPVSGKSAALAFPATLGNASGSIRIPVDDAGEPMFDGMLVSLRGLPRLAVTGAAFVYEAWLQDSQGGRTSLGRFDLDVAGQFAGGSNPFAALASHPPQPGDQVRITVEPIDDPEPDVPYPFTPLSGRFQFPTP